MNWHEEFVQSGGAGLPSAQAAALLARFTGHWFSQAAGGPQYALCIGFDSAPCHGIAGLTVHVDESRPVVWAPGDGRLEERSMGCPLPHGLHVISSLAIPGDNELEALWAQIYQRLLQTDSVAPKVRAYHLLSYVQYVNRVFGLIGAARPDSYNTLTRWYSGHPGAFEVAAGDADHPAKGRLRRLGVHMVGQAVREDASLRHDNSHDPKHSCTQLEYFLHGKPDFWMEQPGHAEAYEDWHVE